MKFQPFLRTYDGNVRRSQVFGNLLQADGWVVQIDLTSTESGLRLRAEVLERGAGGISLGIAASFPKGSHLAIPGAIYDGNRFRQLPLKYPCILEDPADFRPDLLTTTARIPALPHLQLLAGDASLPAIGISEAGLWVRAGQECAWGQIGLEGVETDELQVAFLLPGVREGKVYDATPEWRDSPDLAPSPNVGETLEVDFLVHEFLPGTPVALYRELMAIWGVHEGSPELHQLPFSAAADLIEDKHNQHYWNEQDGYYMLSDGSWEYGQWQSGWVGGGIQMYGLAHSPNPLTQGRIEKMLDFVTGPAQHPCGLWWSLKVGDEFVTDMVGMDYGHDWHLVRRSGDVLYFLAKTLALREKRGQPIAESRVASIRRGADRLQAIWEAEGRLGHFVAQDSGDIRSGDTTSGAIVPAALVWASRITGDSQYISTAAAIGKYFLTQYLERGYTNGGPGEAAQAPDSESAFALFESCIELARETQEEFWWSSAVDAACHATSWVMDYDFRFPETSTFGKLGIQTRGSVWANAQNKHSAPGICTLSGVGLLHLARHTGDFRFLEVLASIARGTTQYLSREDRPIFGILPGASCERVNTSDWEGERTPVGEGFAVDCWSSISALLSATELPGVYVNPSLGKVFALDHLSADLHGSQLVLRNLTRFDALTSILVEQGQKLEEGFSLDLPRVSVAAGSTVTYRL